MLEIKNTEILGLERSIRASGNPMTIGEINTAIIPIENRDYKRGIALGSNPVGTAHDHFLCGIQVWFDIKYPQYWTIEAERYHWFNIISSQSKMHKLILMGKNSEFDMMFNKYVDPRSIAIVKEYIESYELHKKHGEDVYEPFMKVISNLPMGFELWMTCNLSYLQLKTIYLQRNDHKLTEEWGNFCKWCESLPMFIKLIRKPVDNAL
jgi:hypothetical protein